MRYYLLNSMSSTGGQSPFNEVCVKRLQRKLWMPTVSADLRRDGTNTCEEGSVERCEVDKPYEAQEASRAEQPQQLRDH